MADFYQVRDTRRAVKNMTEEEVTAKYNRNRKEYLKDLDLEYYEWLDHFASMFE